MVRPDDKRRSVFTRGKPQTSKDWILFGGQTPPIAIDGERLTWKKAQKKAKKNIISETINNTIPYRNPCLTVNVWCPCPDSITTVINQENKTVEKINQAAWNIILSKKRSEGTSEGWR